MADDNDLIPLSDNDIHSRLATLTGWVYHNNTISKSFEFASFTDAVMFINSLVLFCNSIDHHPDMMVSYKKVRFELTRFSVGSKVTARDFTVAQQIEDNFEKYSNRRIK